MRRSSKMTTIQLTIRIRVAVTASVALVVLLGAEVAADGGRSESAQPDCTVLVVHGR